MSYHLLWIPSLSVCLVCAQFSETIRPPPRLAAAALLVRGLGKTERLPHPRESIAAVVGHDAALFYVADEALWDLSGRLVLSHVGLAAVNGHAEVMVVFQGLWMHMAHESRMAVICFS